MGFKDVTDDSEPSGPTPDDIERSRRGLTSVVETFYRRLNSWLSGRFNRQLSDSVGEKALAEKMVEILEIDSRVLGPFELACVAHLEYYADVIGQGELANNQRINSNIPHAEAVAGPTELKFV